MTQLADDIGSIMRAGCFRTFPPLEDQILRCGRLDLSEVRYWPLSRDRRRASSALMLFSTSFPTDNESTTSSLRCEYGAVLLPDACDV
jgi:hypothetical protein